MGVDTVRYPDNNYRIEIEIPGRPDSTKQTEKETGWQGVLLQKGSELRCTQQQMACAKAVAFLCQVNGTPTT